MSNSCSFAKVVTRKATLSSSLPAFCSEILVEVVEDGNALGDPLLVVRVGRGNAGDQTGDPGRFLAAKLRVFQVDVMNDLADCLQRRISDAGSGK